MDGKAKLNCTANSDTRAASHDTSTLSRAGSTNSEDPNLDNSANAQAPNLNLEGLELVIQVSRDPQQHTPCLTCFFKLSPEL